MIGQTVRGAQRGGAVRANAASAANGGVVSFSMRGGLVAQQRRGGESRIEGFVAVVRLLEHRSLDARCIRVGGRTRFGDDRVDRFEEKTTRAESVFSHASSFEFEKSLV